LTEPIRIVRIESRWPVALVMLAAVVLLSLLPARLRIFPIWLPFVLCVVVIVPMAALSLSTRKASWLRLENAAIAIILLFAAVGIVDQLVRLFSEMIRRSAEVTGLQLLSSSIAIWVTNALMFALLYWRLDRGGPEARANRADAKRDWIFPVEDATEITNDWRPVFVDYLFVAFCTATAFSPAEAQPMTSRAKLMLMLESMISLVTVVAVAARAINILGS